MLYPKATVRLMPYNTGAMGKSLGLILHVQQGNNSPHDWFLHGQSNSHFWVSKSGVVEQFIDAGQRSWAQVAGNSTYHSVETEGFDTEPLTDAQVDALSALYAWGHAEFGWPLDLAEKPGDSGFGWHGMGGQAWGGHFGCPGNLRKPQRTRILDALTTTPQPAPITGDDMAVRFVTASGAPGPWYLWDGFKKRTVAPGENVTLVADGIVANAAVLVKTPAQIAAIPNA